MEILQEMHQVEAVGDPVKGAPPQRSSPEKKKETVK
jgi:hypothetical protein